MDRITASATAGRRAAGLGVRRRMSVAALCALLVTGLLGALAASASARGGSGTVTAFGVGPVRFDHSRPARLRAFAGSPNRIVYWNAEGSVTTSSRAAWQIWQFRYPRNGYTWYSFYRSGRTWLLGQFDTSLERFHTARGTRVGMSYSQAQHREGVSWSGGCIDQGFWHVHIRGGQRFTVLVGATPGQPVHALHAFGPHDLPC